MEQIAERFKNYDEHLLFESMNEEFDGSYSERIKSTIKILMTTTRYSLILFGKQEITIQSVG